MLDLLIPAGVVLLVLLAVAVLLVRPDVQPQEIGWLDDRDGHASAGLPPYYQRGDFDQPRDEADVVDLLIARRRASRN